MYLNSTRLRVLHSLPRDDGALYGHNGACLFRSQQRCTCRFARPTPPHSTASTLVSTPSMSGGGWVGPRQQAEKSSVCAAHGCESSGPSGRVWGAWWRNIPRASQASRHRLHRHVISPPPLAHCHPTSDHHPSHGAAVHFDAVHASTDASRATRRDAPRTFRGADGGDRLPRSARLHSVRGLGRRSSLRRHDVTTDEHALCAFRCADRQRGRDRHLVHPRLRDRGRSDDRQLSRHQLRHRRYGLCQGDSRRREVPRSPRRDGQGGRRFARPARSAARRCRE